MPSQLNAPISVLPPGARTCTLLYKPAHHTGRNKMRAYRIFFLVIATAVAGMCGTCNDRPTADGPTPTALGISFIPGSTSTLRMERDGRTYEIDVVAQTVREIDPPPGTVSSQIGGARAPSSGLSGQPGGAPIFAKNCATCHGADAKGVAGLRTPDFTD